MPETRFCEMPTCDDEAMDGETILVSLDANTVLKRRVCYHCSEVYLVGSQHGRFRAIRQIQGHIENLQALGDDAAVNVLQALLPLLDSTDDPGEADAKYEDDSDDEHDEGE